MHKQLKVIVEWQKHEVYEENLIAMQYFCYFFIHKIYMNQMAGLKWFMIQIFNYLTFIE